jgi:hypothetical protein
MRERADTPLRSAANAVPVIKTSFDHSEHHAAIGRLFSASR